MPLTNPETMLLNALGASLRSEPVSWTQPVSAADWQAFWQLAAHQKVLPLVFESVYPCESAKNEPLVLRWKFPVLRQVTEQIQRTGGFLALYSHLRSLGFHPLVVKGILCRSIFPQGDHRVSSDEDLLIPDAEFLPCCDALRAYGMAPTGNDSPDQFEIGWAKGALYVELHRALFPPESHAFRSQNALFQTVHSTAEEYPVECGQAVWSMPPHEHLLYLILHAHKHFIHSGFGIRQVCDIALWADHFKNRIDWDRLYAQCRDSSSLFFAAALFRIARESLGIPLALPPRWAAVPADPEPMLRDLLSGGVFGATDLSRLHSSTITLNAVEADRSHRRFPLLQSLFPPREKLLVQYPVLIDHPRRLPLVWAKRIAAYLRETKTTPENQTAETLRIGRERVELLRFYGIIR